MDLEVEVAKLRLLKSEYQSTQYQLEDRLLKRYPEQIKKKEAQIAGIKADQKTAEQHPKSEIVILKYCYHFLANAVKDGKKQIVAFLHLSKARVYEFYP